MGAAAAAALALALALGHGARAEWNASLPEPLLLPGEIDTCAGTS